MIRNIAFVVLGVLTLLLVLIFNQHTFVREYQVINSDFKYNEQGTFGYQITDIVYYPDKSIKINKPTETSEYELFLARVYSKLEKSQHLFGKLAFNLIRFLHPPVWNKHPGEGTLEIHGVFYVMETSTIDDFFTHDSFTVRLNNSDIRMYGYDRSNYGLDGYYPGDKHIGFNLSYFPIPKQDFDNLKVKYECPNSGEVITHTVPIDLKKEILTFFDWERTKFMR